MRLIDAERLTREILNSVDWIELEAKNIIRRIEADGRIEDTKVMSDDETEALAAGIKAAVQTIVKIIREAPAKNAARLLTLEEVCGPDQCWLETPNGACGYADFVLGLDNRIEVYRPNHNMEKVWIDEYGQLWRCWSVRPTPEQREAARWNETD